MTLIYDDPLIYTLYWWKMVELMEAVYRIKVYIKFTIYCGMEAGKTSIATQQQ
jgi:hypothetical protein